MSSAAATAAVRSSTLQDYWTMSAAPIIFGRENFRFTLQRTARKLPPAQLDPLIEHANWQRVDTQRTAEINFRMPQNVTDGAFVATGDSVLCEVSTSGANAAAWTPLWQLKVHAPSQSISDGVVSISLSGVLSGLLESKLAWKYRADHGHARGWTAVEGTRDVCRRMGVDIDSLPAASHRVTKLLEHNATGMDVIVRFWKAEREATGRQFDIDISTGRLRITELREPQYMLLLRDSIIDATVERSLKNMATTIIATATVETRGSAKAKKLRVEVTDAARRRRYGYRVKTVTAPRGIDTAAELRVWARRQLASFKRPTQAVTLTVPGIPSVDRGDATRITLPSADVDALAYVTDARHDLSAGSYTIDLTVDFTDPFADARKARVEKAKANAAARRKHSTAAKATAPTPKRAATRSGI